MLLLLTLFGSLALLIAGAWCVSEGGDILGEKYDATIVGGFLIAWLNTAPETIFFITALESGNPTFAIGAISGSVIVVCTIAVGFTIYFGAGARRNKTILILPGVRHQAQILGICLIVAVLVLIFGFRPELGFFGIFMYMAFIVYTLLGKQASNVPHHHHSTLSTDDKGHDAVATTSNSDATSASSTSNSISNNSDNSIIIVESGTTATKPTESNPIEKINVVHHDVEALDDEEESEGDHPAWKGFAYLCAGGALIYIFSEPFIDTVVEVGKSFGINPIVLAFFFAPIASEAPEILESISLSRKGKTQNINIAFSNLVGGTISKLTLLLGILCLYGEWRGFPWVSPSYTVSLILIIICAGTTASFSFSAEHQQSKGLGLIGLFAASGLVQYICTAYSQY